MTYIPYLGTFFSHGTPVWPWPVINMRPTTYMNMMWTSQGGPAEESLKQCH